MNGGKCFNCGLVNFAHAAICKRCGVALDDDNARPQADAAWTNEADAPERRGIIRRVSAVGGMTVLLLALFYVSLLETSAPPTLVERQAINRAIAHIEQRGFTRDAFLLRRLANFRTTDNWWNNWLGHADAYAATNFPLEVVTLYPEFFKVPADDTERAVILLHEARHLAGADETKAFTTVWRDRRRLGWTKQKYASTRIWKNVEEFTRRHAPDIFQCGTEGDADCEVETVDSSQ